MLKESFSIYFPNNDYYTAITPVVEAGIRYSRFIDKSNKHSLLINAGYQYGTRDYKQECLAVFFVGKWTEILILILHYFTYI